MSREQATRARGLWHVGGGRIELREETLAPAETRVRALFSAVSRGTERLVHQGRVPESERARMRGPHMGGAFPFPVKYGYAWVGLVEAGPEALIGRHVFALHPHQTRAALPADALHLLPEGLPPARATLAANMETALNALWDGGAVAGDRCVVVGAGPLGVLTAALLARLPGAEVAVIDKLAERADITRLFGAEFRRPEEAPRECDVAFHCSASAAGLATALEALGDEGTLVEMSWHGAGETPAPLGGAFHSRRLRIVSSQVGALPPARRPRWSRRRRLATALRLLLDPRYDALLGPPIPFEATPARLPALLSGPPSGLAPLIAY